MNDNIRLLSTIIWFSAVGCTLASFFVVIFTWGEHWQFLLGSMGTVVLSGSIVTYTAIPK